MPSILSRSTMSSRHGARGSVNVKANMSASTSPFWREEPSEMAAANNEYTINQSDPYYEHNIITGASSASSGMRSPQYGKSSSSLSSMRRTCSMNFNDFQQVDSCESSSLLVASRNSTQPTTSNSGGGDDTWGHFVDVAAAEEAIVKHSRILSSDSDTFSAMYSR